MPETGRSQAELKRFLQSYLIAFVAGLVAQVAGLASVDAGQGAVIVVFDLLLLPLAFPVSALLFLRGARWMQESGREGVFGFVGLGIASVFLPVAVALYLMLKDEGGSPAELLAGAGLMALNLAVTYGGFVGLLYWRFAGFVVSDARFRGEYGSASWGWVLGLGVAALLLWQAAFWRIALPVMDRW